MIIHQTWKTCKVPTQWQPLVRSWIDNHPNWQYLLWTDSDNRRFVEDHYPQFLLTYDAYSFDIQRADAVRYLLLHRFGGVYVDMDFECLQPIDGLLKGEQFVTCNEPAIQAAQHGEAALITNAFMASVPHHPFLADVLMELLRTDPTAVTHSDILKTTGPIMLTRVHDEKPRPDVTVLDEKVLFPFPANSYELLTIARERDGHLGLKENCRLNGTYGIHHWANSWVGNLAGTLDNPTPYQVAGYRLYPGRDSHGYDIRNAGRNVTKLADACTAEPDAIAFNTDGFLKHRLLPPSQWSVLSNKDGCEGLYVRTGIELPLEEPESGSIKEALLANSVPLAEIPHSSSSPPDLLLRGPYTSYSGYGCTVRNFARHLTAAGAKIGLMDLPEWSPAILPENLRDPAYNAMTGAAEASTVIQFCMPHQVVPLPERLNANLTMFEASKIPTVWVASNLSHDLVLVPTESSKDAWISSGFPEDRIEICPLGVDTGKFRPGIEPLPLKARDGRPIADYKVRFLNNSEVVPRKNLLALLRVWIQETTRSDDAILIMKLNASGSMSALKLLRDLHFLESEIGKSREEAAPILFFDDILSDQDMPRLYAAATHYWSMSFGEGWDQPMTEAGAAGLQLLAPNHSAYEAYLNDAIAWMIPCRQIPIRLGQEYEWLFGGAEWWQPDQQVAAEYIRTAIDLAGRPARTARQHLVGNFTLSQSADRLLEILDRLHARFGHTDSRRSGTSPVSP